MSIQFNHASNFKSKTTATAVLNLPRGAICSSSVQLPGGPLTGDKVKRTLVLQCVTQGMPRSLAEVSIGYPTDFLAVLNNIPVPGNIVDDVTINANAAITAARDGDPSTRFVDIQRDFLRISQIHAASAAQDGSTNAAPGAHAASEPEDSDTDESDSTKSSRGSKGSKTSARTRGTSKPTEPSRKNTGGDGGADAADASTFSGAPAAASLADAAASSNVSRHSIQARSNL